MPFASRRGRGSPSCTATVSHWTGALVSNSCSRSVERTQVYVCPWGLRPFTDERAYVWGAIRRLVPIIRAAIGLLPSFPARTLLIVDQNYRESYQLAWMLRLMTQAQPVSTTMQRYCATFSQMRVFDIERCGTLASYPSRICITCLERCEHTPPSFLGYRRSPKAALPAHPAVA